MASKVAEVILKYTTKGTVEAANASQDIIDSLEKTKKASLDLAAVNKSLNDSFAQLARQQAIDEIAQEFARAKNEGKDFTSSVERATQALADIGASEDEIMRVARAFEGATNEAERLSRVPSPNMPTVGGRSAGTPSTTDQIGDAGTAISAAAGLFQGQANSSLSDLGQFFDLAEYSLRAIQALTTTIAGPLAVGVAAVIGGVTLLNQRYEEAKRRAEEYAQALRNEADARQQSINAATTGDVGSILTQIAELRTQAQNIFDTQIAPQREIQRQEFENLLPIEMERLRPENLSASEEELRRIASESLSGGRVSQAFRDAGDTIEQVRTEQLEPLLTSIGALESSLQAADFIGGLNQQFKDAQLRRELLQEGDSSDAEQELSNVTANIDQYTSRLAQIETALAEARANGNTILESALEIDQAKTEADLKSAQATQAVYESVIPLIEKNEEAARAEEAKAESQEKAEQRIAEAIQQRAQVELQTQQFLQTATAKSARERLASLEAERAALISANEGLQRSGTEAALAQVELNNRQLESINVTQGLIEAELPLLQLRDRQAQQIRDGIEGVRESISNYTQLQDLIQNASLEQVQNRLEAIAIERAAIEQYLPRLRQLARQSEEGAQALQEYQSRLRDLDAEQARLYNAAVPAAYQREIEKLNQELEKLAQGRNDALARLAERLDRDLARLNEDFAEQERRDGVRRSEELERFQQDEIRRTQDYYRSLRDIQRNFDRDARRAAASLDANALQQSIEARNEQIDRANEQFEVESDRRRQDLEDLIQNLDQQEQERARDYQRRYNELIRASQAERAAIDAKYRADVAAAQANFNATVSFLNQEQTSRRTGYTNILRDTSSFINGLINEFARLRQSSNVVIPNTEIITPEEAIQQQQGGSLSLATVATGGMNLTFNITESGNANLTAQTIIRIIKDELR